MISLEKSVSTWQFPVNKVIKFGPCWEAPYLWLVTYWQWHYRISWENGGRITKTPALIAGAPFPFPSFVLFSLPLSLPFLRLSRRLQKHYVYQTLQTTKTNLEKPFLKQTIINRFNLLHVCPFMRPFVFAVFSYLMLVFWGFILCFTHFAGSSLFLNYNTFRATAPVSQCSAYSFLGKYPGKKLTL